MYEALRKGADINELYEKTYIKPWFIKQMKELVELEEKILKYKGESFAGRTVDSSKERWICRQISVKITQYSGKEIRKADITGIVQSWEPVPVSGVENAAYYYSTYNAPDKVSSKQ